MNRPDDYLAVKNLEGSHCGEKALLVLGGTSGRNWLTLKNEINPDIILGANGTCFEIPDLDFHLVVENLSMATGKAKKGDKHYARIAQIISPENTAKVKLISYLNWKYNVVDSRVKAIKIKRMGELRENYDEQFKEFSFRKYGNGFLAGPLFKKSGCLSSPGIRFRIGTVATQLLHLAGILGVREIHTIGMDFCFKETKHHWYSYTNYQPDRFRTDKMFTEYLGLKTQWDWVLGAQWLVEIVKPIVTKENVIWVDHSEGLLEKL